MGNSAPNLAKLIAKDLATVGRVPFILLMLILATALGVVLTTNMSRLAISEKDHTLNTRQKLDNEWRNLLLEETSLSDSSRVENIAKTDLHMQRPNSSKEVAFSE